MRRRQFLGGVGVGLAALGVGAFTGSATDAQEPAPRSGPIRLNSNENPHGPFPSAIAAACDAVPDAFRYPWQIADRLRRSLARHHGISRDQVLLGCGSIELLRMATEELVSSEHRAVVAEPTFEAVVNYAPLASGRAVKTPLAEDYSHDLDAMLEASRKGTGLVFFCNPNNPTGSITEKSDVEAFVREVPSTVTVLADEAYADYVTDPRFESCDRYVRAGAANVIVTRTFSKLYGMAGMRIGYAIGPADLLRRLRRRKSGGSANSIACAAALASLEDKESIERTRKRNRELRESTRVELQKMGLKTIASETNFLAIDVGRPAHEIIDAMSRRGVRIGRPFPGIPEHVRVSIGLESEMRTFLERLRLVL